MKDKKNIVNHAIALGILLVGFILCRYTFFDIHGMKEFPKILLVLGLVVMAISALTKKKFLPYFVSMGYIIGFVFGFVFQVSRIDANGISVNNLWVIWTVVNVVFIGVGVICEKCFGKQLKTFDMKKSIVTKAAIVILLLLC